MAFFSKYLCKLNLQNLEETTGLVLELQREEY